MSLYTPLPRMTFDKKAYNAKWREKNRERIRLQAKKYRQGNGKAPVRAGDLRNKYGLTPEQYDAMHKIQNGLCAICSKTVDENGKRLSVDHCHVTNTVRGLLCYRCNTGLASFSDKPELIRKALIYLGDCSHEALLGAAKKAIDAFSHIATNRYYNQDILLSAQNSLSVAITQAEQKEAVS